MNRFLRNQVRVTEWVRTVFSEKEATDVPERSLRMAEEALELAQACEVDAATLHRLVDYVMSRPVGKPAQEIAGTMVTVYALAGALGVDADSEFEVELERIQRPEVIERCQRRQHEKRAALAIGPIMSPEVLETLAKRSQSTVDSIVAHLDERLAETGDLYGIRITHESWLTVDGGPDLVGDRERLKALAKLWEASLKGEPSPSTVTYEPAPYTGNDPADAVTVEGFLDREGHSDSSLVAVERKPKTPAPDDFCDDGKTGALR